MGELLMQYQAMRQHRGMRFRGLALLPRLRRRTNRQADSDIPGSTHAAMATEHRRPLDLRGSFIVVIGPSSESGWYTWIVDGGIERQHRSYRMEPIHEVVFRALGDYCSRYD